MGGQRKRKTSQTFDADKEHLKLDDKDVSSPTAKDIQALVQELRTHQVELEAQVEKLRATQ